MEKQLESCFQTAECAVYEKSTNVSVGLLSKTHSDQCCPDFACVCDTCPGSIVTRESLTARAELCEMVGVRPSDVSRKCCKNYEIQCNSSCTCSDLNLQCGAVPGCSQETSEMLFVIYFS